MGCVVNATPRPLYPRERPRIGLAGAENLAPPGFDPRTFQPVASHYTGPQFRGVESINFQYKRTHTTSIFRVEKSGPI